MALGRADTEGFLCQMTIAPARTNACRSRLPWRAFFRSPDAAGRFRNGCSARTSDTTLADEKSRVKKIYVTYAHVLMSQPIRVENISMGFQQGSRDGATSARAHVLRQVTDEIGERIHQHHRGDHQQEHR